MPYGSHSRCRLCHFAIDPFRLKLQGLEEESSLSVNSFSSSLDSASAVKEEKKAEDAYEVQGTR